MQKEPLNEIGNVTIPEEDGITMNQATSIINHNNRSIYECINDAYKLGYIIANKRNSGKKVSYE